MNVRRYGRVLYLLAFVVVQQFTTVFVAYPTLELLGIVGVGVVGLDALVCAIRRWRSLNASLLEEDAPGE